MNANATPDDLDLTLGTHRDFVRRDKAGANGVNTSEHVASLGGQLFGRHLIAIEVAGTLLLVALVGAVAIVAHDRTKLKHYATHPDNAR